MDSADVLKAQKVLDMAGIIASASWEQGNESVKKSEWANRQC